MLKSWELVCHQRVFLTDSVLLFADGPLKTDLGCTAFRGSEITLYGEIPPQLPVEKHEKMQPRTKVKTNGHFTTFMQVSFFGIKQKQRKF